jgi:hypothetical protein
MGDEPELRVARWWKMMMMVRFRRLWTPRCEGEPSVLVRKCWVQGQMLMLELQPRWYRYAPMALEETPSFQIGRGRTLRVRRKPSLCVRMHMDDPID